MKNPIDYRKASIRVVLILMFISPGILLSQASNYALDSREQKRTIDSIGARLEANYVFPEVAKDMHRLVTTKYTQGDYKSVTDPFAFANRLTEDLRSVSKDLHLRVQYAPELIAERANAVSEADQAALEARWIAEMERDNFGFKEVKILDGNIGYLDLRAFMAPEYAGETAVAAMNFLSNADALIIDLRQNGGGSPGMIQLISSYIFGAEPIHLNNFYWRPSDEHTQTWTLPHIQGKRNPEADVFVLTSKNTFSAAEEFSYNLKNLERATLIGETTGGGAHPGGTMPATDKYTVWIPQGRAINPITHTNWEGTGVSPHIEVPAENALDRARVEALEKLLQKTSDTTRANYYSWYLEGIKSRTNPVKVDAETLQRYVGDYGPRKITLEEGQLYYQREGRTKYNLVPMGNHWFILDGLDTFRIEFIEEGMAISGLIGHYDNGNTDNSPKTD